MGESVNLRESRLDGAVSLILQRFCPPCIATSWEESLQKWGENDARLPCERWLQISSKLRSRVYDTMITAEKQRKLRENRVASVIRRFRSYNCKNCVAENASKNSRIRESTRKSHKRCKPSRSSVEYHLNPYRNGCAPIWNKFNFQERALETFYIRFIASVISSRGEIR